MNGSGGGIANFTDVAKTFKGIVHAIKEYKQKLIECKVQIYVRRAGPNYKVRICDHRVDVMCITEIPLCRPGCL